jgi:general secretion pathway protein D
MRFPLSTLSAILLTVVVAFAQPGPPGAVQAPGTPVTPGVTQPAPKKDFVTLNMPKAGVEDVLSFYESLTNKRIIRDANLAGQELTLVVQGSLTREEAVAIIESALLMNNYAIVPVDPQTIKILGPSRAPRTEGLPLYNDIGQLGGQGDKVFSFYKPLAFITPEEAMSVIQGVVQMNAYGSVVPVPNTNALIITDKTPVILKALGILEFIDVEPARVVTEFVQLQRANAERVVELLDEIFTSGDDGRGGAAARPPNPGQPATPGQQAPEAPAAGAGNARYEDQLIAGKAKFLADKRTNRILVVTRVESYRYVRELIAQIDSAASFEEPYTRVLDYVPVTDIFSILSDMLADPDTEVQGSSGGARQGGASDSPFANGGATGGFGNSQGGSSGLGGASRPDRLTAESQQGAPQAVTIGEIRLIADSNANSIIVFGPPEAKLRADQILDLLDKRPRQVYLAVVIGQLRLDNDLEYGVSYLLRSQALRSVNRALGTEGTTSNLALSSLNPAQLPGGNFPNPADIVNPGSIADLGLSALSGLTVYGTIADSVDVFARFLESTNRFRTLSRPVIYTTNNRKATILSGRQVPVTTQSLTTATGGGITGNGSSIASNIQFKDVVLKLEVIPLINSDREVNLVIAQTNDNIIGQDIISGNPYPVIGTQEITTSVRVPNGATIVLGGLITEDKQRDTSGIPYISEIPVLGTLLGGRTASNNIRQELIVMIQPFVVDSNPEMLRASAYESDKSELGRDAQEITAPIAEPVNPLPAWEPPPPVEEEKKKKWRWPWSNGRDS